MTESSGSYKTYYRINTGKLSIILRLPVGCAILVIGPERTKTATYTSVEAVPHPGCQWGWLAEIEDGRVLFFDGAGGLWIALALADDAGTVGLVVLAFWLAFTVA